MWGAPAALTPCGVRVGGVPESVTAQALAERGQQGWMCPMALEQAPSQPLILWQQLASQVEE